MKSSKIKIKYAMTVITAFLAVMLCALGMLMYSAKADNVYRWVVKSGNWEVSVDNGTKIYKKTSGGHAQLDFPENIDIEYGDEVSFDFRMDHIDGADANIGLILNIADGDTWFARFINGEAAAMVYNDSLTLNQLANAPVMTFDTAEWVNFRFTTTPGNNGANASNLWLYLNDTAVAVFDTGSSLKGITLTLNAWNMYPCIKNIKVKGVDTAVSGLSMPGWSETNENGEDVYTSNAFIGTLSPTVEAEEFNTFYCAARMNDIPSDLSDGNISILVYVSDTDRYMFEYNPAPSRRYARLRFFDAEHENEGTEIAKTNIDILPVSEWFELRAVFETDYLSFYINGKRVLSHFDTGRNDFSNASAKISYWNVDTSVKGLNVSTTEKDYNDVSYVEFEFEKSLSAIVFNAVGGDVSWDGDSALVMTVTDARPVLASPTIDVSVGSKYSAKLSVINTLKVRLKNVTAADKLTLSYITAEDPEYDSNKQKTFDIAPDSDYKTYYFNISDVADCGHWKTNAALKSCNCYLRGFKFAFEGATSGEVNIDSITFEREDRIWEKAATELNCVADKTNSTVTVSGALAEKYAGQKVTVYETSIQNYNELPEYSGNVVIASGVADSDGNFEITFPLVRDNGVSHLSTVFLAAVGNDKLDDSFMIENWRDFSENPYAFELNDLTVDVTDARFGAKGDGFTNDNGAIQSAIDYVSAQGGGTVRLVGAPEDTYGRRYIATQLNMKSNVELRIEKGAVLWQSSRFEDYDYGDYLPVYGHDIYIEGVPWTHAAASWNLPFVYINEVENVRVTGGGEIRMMDDGTQWLDGNGYDWDSNITVNCGSLIHIHPIASHKSSGVEVSDITVKRSNIWHLPNINSERLFFGNVKLTEVSCVNGDGITLGVGTRDVVIDRCTLYSNDDAIVISAEYDDPRGYGKAWWSSHPNDFSGVANIEVTHSNMFGGHGLTFITWGSDDPNAENGEIKNIRAVDNVLGGTSTAVGCWTDNPFYGESYMGTYDQCEKNDYSPIKDIYIVNNIYTAPTLLGTWDGNTPELAQATNAITDCGIFSPSQFVNGAFDKTLRYATEEQWVTGLSYWSSKTDVGGEVGTEKVGTRQTTVINTTTTLTVGDYAGYIKGNGELYQGLHLTVGSYEFAINAKLISGNAKLFARSAVSGEIIAEQAIAASESFAPVKLALYVSKGTTVQLGVMHEGDEDQIVYIDDARVIAAFDPDMFVIVGQKHVWSFDNGNGFTSYNPLGASVTVSNGMLTVDDRAEYKIMLDQTGALKEFDLSVDIIPFGNINAGLYLLATEVKHASDMITAYNVQVEYNPDNGYYVVRLHSFSANTGYIGNLTESEHIQYSGGKITLRAVVKFNTLFVFTDHSDEYLFAYELPDGYEGGNVGLRSQYRTTHFDNLMLTTAQFAEGAGVRTELDKTLALADKFVESMYTAESFAALKSAIAEAAALGVSATQDEIDGVNAKLNAAINGLQKADIKPIDPSTPDTPNTPNTPEPETVVVYDKDVGMTVGFYILLGLLIAGIAAAVAFVIISKKKAKKNN